MVRIIFVSLAYHYKIAGNHMSDGACHTGTVTVLAQ